MKNKFKKFLSILLASLIFSTSNHLFAFNGEISDEVASLLDSYVDKYNDNLGEEFENELVRSVWQLYIGQFARIKKRLKALSNVCYVMILDCDKINDPQRQRLKRTLLCIIGNSNYNFIMRKYADLCTNTFLERTTYSYGTIMQDPIMAVKYLKNLLYFSRTGNQLYVQPRESWCNFIHILRIYNTFQRDIKYINEQ